MLTSPGIASNEEMISGGLLATPPFQRHTNTGHGHNGLKFNIRESKV